MSRESHRPPYRQSNLFAVFFLLLAMIFAAATSVAQGPSGPEFQVNSYTTGDQSLPQVAKAADGSFIVFWSRLFGTDDTFSRVFDGNGQPLTGDIPWPGRGIDDVVADPAGGFLAAWDEDIGGDKKIFVRRVSSTGDPVGAIQQVNQGTGDLRTPQIAVDPNGGFRVVWSDVASIQSRRLDSAGAPAGSEFTISSQGNQFTPDIAINDLGDFLVTWTKTNSPSGIFSQFLDASGAATEGPQLLEGLFNPAVATDGAGRFVVVSRGYFNTPTSWVGSDGTPLFDVLLEGLPSTSNQPGIDCYGTGRCAATWIGNDGEIKARWLSSSEVLTGILPVNDLVTGTQSWPDVDCTDDGECVVVWQSFQVPSTPSADQGRGIRAQRFTDQPTFRLTVSPYSQNVCPGDSADFPISIEAFNDFTDSIDLVASSTIPGGGVTVTPGLVSVGNEVATFEASVPQAAPNGTYRVFVGGVSGDAVGGDEAFVRVIQHPAPTLTTPDGVTYCAGSLEPLDWDSIPGAPGFVAEIATDAAFTNIVRSIDTFGTGAEIPSDLTPGRYFWRVAACANLSEVRSFTILGDCGFDPVTTETRVDQGPDSLVENVESPAVAQSCEGRSLVAWTEAFAGTRRIAGRFFQDDSPLGIAFTISPLGGAPENATVRVLDSGEFLVAWNNGATLFWRLYDAGLVAGPVLSAPLAAVPARLEVGPQGDIGGIWVDGLFIRGERFTRDGVSLGAFEHEETAADVEIDGVPDLGLSEGGFVILWRWSASFSGSDLRSQMKAQIFDDLNQPLGVELLIQAANSFPGASARDGFHPGERVTIEPSGEFTVHYSTFDYLNVQGDAGTSNAIRQRSFAANGAPQDGGRIVEQTQKSIDPPELDAISAASGPNGEFLVVWNDEIQEIQARRLLAPSAPESAPAGSLSGRSAREIAVDVATPTTGGAVVWVSDECAPGASPCLFYRTLRSGPGLLQDDFESGGLGSWCRRVP